jgi:hypothetical protein
MYWLGYPTPSLWLSSLAGVEGAGWTTERRRATAAAGGRSSCAGSASGWERNNPRAARRHVATRAARTSPATCGSSERCARRALQPCPATPSHRPSCDAAPLHATHSPCAHVPAQTEPKARCRTRAASTRPADINATTPRTSRSKAAARTSRPGDTPRRTLETEVPVRIQVYFFQSPLLDHASLSSAIHLRAHRSTRPMGGESPGLTVCVSRRGVITAVSPHDSACSATGPPPSAPGPSHHSSCPT